MTGIAQLAFAYTRTRALRARLLGPEDADRLRAASGPQAHAAALHAIGIEAHRPADVRDACLARFASDADKLVRAWPIGRGLLFAVAGLLEIENLKLAFRAFLPDVDGWEKQWLQLGRVARLPMEPFQQAASLRAAIDAISRGPYGAIALSVLRAHEGDHAAVEIALDRWASSRIVAEAKALPANQSAARELALRVVRERDLDVLLRRAYAIPPDAAAGATALLREELRPDALRALAQWTPASGSLQPLLPRRLVHAPAPDPAALQLALRRERREACLRAYLGQPFQLAAAVALLLLRLEEIRAASAIAESRWDEGDDSTALRSALAASAMGA